MKIIFFSNLGKKKGRLLASFFAAAALVTQTLRCSGSKIDCASAHSKTLRAAARAHPCTSSGAAHLWDILKAC
jgi:hypothetical protein